MSNVVCWIECALSVCAGGAFGLVAFSSDLLTLCIVNENVGETGISLMESGHFFP